MLTIRGTMTIRVSAVLAWLGLKAMALAWLLLALAWQI